MIAAPSLLVALLQVVAAIPRPPPPPRVRGQPVVYSDRLLLQGLLIMIVRRLETVPLLVAVLHAPAAEMARVRALLAVNGRPPHRRTWERRLERVLSILPPRSAVWVARWSTSPAPGPTMVAPSRWTARCCGRRVGSGTSSSGPRICCRA